VQLAVGVDAFPAMALYCFLMTTMISGILPNNLGTVPQKISFKTLQHSEPFSFASPLSRIA
jgi:hypothetical protein